MFFLTLQPLIYIAVGAGLLAILRASYALLILLFTGKIYNESSAFISDYNDELHLRLLFTGKNFFGIFRDCTVLFIVTVLVTYFTLMAASALWGIWTFLFPFSMYFVITLSVSFIIGFASYIIRKHLLRKKNFVNNLNGTEPEKLFKVVSEGD